MALFAPHVPPQVDAPQSLRHPASPKLFKALKVVRRSWSLFGGLCCLLLLVTWSPFLLEAQATAPAANLGSAAVGSSTTATVTFTYTGTAAITGVTVLTQGVTGLDFAQDGGSSCAQASPAVGGTCTVSVKFTPGAPGTRVGAVELATSDGPAAGGVAMISGTGLGGQLALMSGTKSAITGTSGFSSPSALTVDAAGNVYVASSGNGSVYKETISGTVAMQATITTTLGQAGGIAIDGAGNLFVASPTQRAVYEYPYTASTGIYASAPKTIRSCANACWSVAVDPAGNLFVGETTTVYEAVLSNGSYAAFNSLVSGYSNVTGLAVDASDNLYVADNLSVSVQTLANGAYSKTVLGSSFTKVNGVALDAAGDIYVSDSQYSYLLRYSPNGSGGYTGSTVTSPSTGGVALASTGQLYVNDGGTNLYKIDLTTLSSSTSSSVGYSSPETMVTVTNTGNAALTFSGFSAAAPFSAATDGCAAASNSIPSLGTCALGYTFAPTDSTTPQTGSLAVASSGGMGTLNLTGNVTGTATQLVYTMPPNRTVIAGGNVGTLQVAIEDANGYYVTSPASVTLTVTYPASGTPPSSDPYTVSTTNGLATFPTASVPLTKAGLYTYKATSGSLSSTTGGSVIAGPAAMLSISPANSSAHVGVSDNITVITQDAYGNAASSSHTIHLSSSPSTATLPADYVLSSGTATKAVAFNVAGTYTVTAQDLTNSNVIGATTASITVSNVPVFTVTTATDDATGSAVNCPDQANGGAVSTNCSLRDAFAAVTALNNASVSSYIPTINFDPGLYGETITMTAASSVNGNFSLAGPGAGANAITLSGGNAVAFLTQAAGSNITNISGLTFSNFNSSAQQAVLAGSGTFTLTNDIFSKNSYTGSGSINGGAVGINGAITVVGCTFSGNTSSTAGGALAAAQTSLAISNSLFSGNTAATFGGAFAGTGTGAITLTNTVFLNNNSTSQGGGALYLSQNGTPLTINNSTFDGNSAGTYGGAIYTLGLLTISGSSFSANQTGSASSFAFGGAIWNSYPTASGSIRNTNFIGNKAVSTGTEAYGGALYMNRMNLTNVLFSGNVASSSNTVQGGALFIAGSTSYSSAITGATFTGNSTGGSANNQSGGAIYQGSGVLNLYNATITGNSAKLGGGIAGGGTLNLYNSVISGNTVTGTYPDASAVTSNSGSYFDIGNTATCTSNCKPVLSALGSFGGGTVGATGYTTPVQVLIPLPGSPLLAAGSTANLNGATADARGIGYPRTLIEDGASHVDAGAAEANYSLAFTQQPTSTTIGKNFSPAPAIQLYESGIPFAPGATGGSLSFSAASGTLSSTSATIGTNGLTTLTASISTPQANDTLTATAKSTATGTITVGTAISLPFSITDTTKASINYLAAPAYIVANGGNAGVVKVGLYTNAGVLDTTATSTDTLKVSATGYMTTTYTQAAVNGVASFDFSAVPLTINGSYTYTATASTYTTDSVTATETVSSQAIGGFTLSGIPQQIFPGTVYVLTVTAKDTTGAGFTGFSGPVSLTSTDASASITPANYTFSTSDAGVHTFSVIFNTAGAQSVIATTNGGASGSETGFVVDGYVWLLNANGTTTKFAETGGSVLSSVGTSSAAATTGGIAADASGTLWSVTPSSNMLDSVNYLGTGAAMYGGGGLNTPTAVAVDGAGAVWIANSGNNSVSQFTNGGTAVSPTTGFTGYQGASYGAPSGIAIDVSGNVWVSNSSTNTVTEIVGAAAPAAPASTALVNSTTGARP